MKIRTPYILLCLLLPALSSCIFGKVDEVMETPTDVQVTFALNVKSPVATKGLDEIDPLSLFVLVYDTEGNFVKELPILNTRIEDGKVRFDCALNVHLPSDASEATPPQYRFMVVTNSTNQQYGLTYDKNGVPAIEQLDFAYYAYKYSSGSTIPMWGVKTYTIQYEDGKLKETQDLGVIDVLRSGAKVSVELVGKALEEGYTIGDIKINRVAAAGYSVPGNWSQTSQTTDLKTGAKGYVKGFRPNNIDPISDVSAFFPAGEDATMKYIYIPEITNDEELAISLVLHKDGETFEFTYDKGIKFAEYDDAGLPTDNKFNVIRNNHYEYKIRAVHTNLDLLEVEYNTLPMIEEEVEIGGEVKYLVLNTDLVQIYGENIDASTLQFTSSSRIVNVELKDTYGHDPKGSRFGNQPDGTYAYYVSKFGQRVQLGTDPGFDIADKEAAMAREQVILENINATAEEQVLQGDIVINSPFIGESDNEIEELKEDSHYDTVRYLEFEVTNEQGLTATFRVEQYPPTVITNIEGFFSYRDDFTRKDDEGPAYWTNYMGNGSITTMGIILNHEHDWTDEANQSEEWFATRQSDRSYSWTTPCEVQGKGVERWEEMRYSLIGHYVNYKSGSTEKSGFYSGGYRPMDHTGVPTRMFFRERYHNLPGASSMDSKGAAVSDPYEKVVINENGEPETRIFRKHYTWDIQTIFWSRYVKKVHPEDTEITITENKVPVKYKRLKGQASIYNIADNYTTYKDGGEIFNDADVIDGGFKFVDYGITGTYRNHRMYHIKATTTSDKYTFGRPTLVDEEGKPTTDADRGVVDNVPANANLVSPSLMLASQLGETNYNYIIANCKKYGYVLPKLSDFYELAKRHCREYVESTYDDLNGNGNHDEGEPVTQYHDWRLPTKAEIEMLIDFQSNSRAMDVVLMGEHFVCITGQPGQGDDEEYWVSSEVPTYKATPEEDIDGRGYTYTGYYIRCVRDVYED